jgi:hypothetical protein
MTRTSKAAYLSGFLDTDGFIGVDDGILHLFRYCVKTGNTTRKVCKYLQKHFGGDFYRVPTDDDIKIYYWKLYGTAAIPAILNELLPFLKVQRKNAADILNQLKVTPAEEIKPNRREIAAYHAGTIDASGFVEPRELYDAPRDLEKFFLSILPYLVEKKTQVNAMLQAIRAPQRP